MTEVTAEQIEDFDALYESQKDFIASIYKHWRTFKYVHDKIGRYPKRFQAETLVNIYIWTAEGISQTEISSRCKLARSTLNKIAANPHLSPEGELLKEALDRGRKLAKSKAGGLIARRYLELIREQELQAQKRIEQGLPVGKVFKWDDEDYEIIYLLRTSLIHLIEYAKTEEKLNDFKKRTALSVNKG